MEILHTTNEEPFVSGTGHFAGWENRLMKLEDTAILFCREGHAHIINLEELYPEFPVGYLRQDSSPVSHETSRRYQPAGRAVQAVYPVGTQALHHPA